MEPSTLPLQLPPQLPQMPSGHCEPGPSVAKPKIPQYANARFPEFYRPVAPPSTLPPLPSQMPLKQEPPKPTKIGPYEVDKTIGRGNHAVVKKAKHKITRTEVAIKIIDKRRLDPENLKKIEREVQVLQRIRHPHIIKLYQVIHTEACLYLITEYAPNGEIYDTIREKKMLSEDMARAKFWQIISAVDYLHKNGIVHRDLKAENLLLDSNNDIKLADFGFSNFYEKENTLDTYCGSPPYAAPEIFEGRRYAGPEVDVWSLGVVLYILISGVLPFEGANLQQLRDRVLSGRIRFPYYMSIECENLIRRMLTINPAKRPTMDQIKAHKWMKTEEYEARYDGSNVITETKEMQSQVLNIMYSMGLDEKSVDKSVYNELYDNYHAIYLMLLERLKESSIKLHQLQLYEQQKKEQALQQQRQLESEGRRRQSEAPRQRPMLNSLREHSTFQTTDCLPTDNKVIDEKIEEKPKEMEKKVPTPKSQPNGTTAPVPPSSSGHCTTTSDTEDRCSTLSRQSTIGTIGSIDEGVEVDYNGSSQSRNTFSSTDLEATTGSGNSLLSYDPQTDPDLLSTLSLNSCPSNSGSADATVCCCCKAQQEAQNKPENSATANNSTETSPCASPQPKCFGEGWRASDNAMFDTLTQPFPTCDKPTTSHLNDKMKKMRLNGPVAQAGAAGLAIGCNMKLNHQHHHTHHRPTLLAHVPKRISLPENLEFQPQMLLNLKQAIHVEKQLGSEKSEKMFKARMAQQQKRLNKARMQMYRQQSYQKQNSMPGTTVMSRLSEEPPPAAPLSPIEDLKHEDAMDTS